MSNTKKYFTPDEVKEAKQGSINFPLAIYEGTDSNNVTSITEVASLSGMAKNNGIATEITFHEKTKSVEGVTTRRLVYRLVENVELPF